MLPTVWQGLEHSQIQHLTLKFPSSRTPKPVSMVPPIPTLVSLKVLDIDPLCYVDDISLLLAESKQLRDLSIVWSPRMREEKEPSVNLNAIFGRCRGQPLKLRKVAIKNLFTHADGSCAGYYDPLTIEEITVINCMGGLGDGGASAFIECPARKIGPPLPQLKFVRGDKPWEGLVELLAQSSGIEKLYIPSPRKAPSPSMGADLSRDSHIEAITKYHGQSLRHLLLPSQWRLSSDHIKHIVQHCPNLEQLGFAARPADFMSIRSLLPSLRNLTALRLLEYPYSNGLSEQWDDFEDFDSREAIDTFVSQAEHNHLPRWLDLGDARVYEIDRVEHDQHPRVRQRNKEAVEHIDIWEMDSFEV
ncbi:MAG: hypothetical protein Q9170_006133 [Blastenia crenularia]